MYCTRCGFQLEDSDLFCGKCGTSVRGGVQPTAGTPILSRPMDQKRIAGVCAGFARYFDMDVTLMRLLWIALAVVTGGLFILVYIAAWIIMPRDYPSAYGQTSRVAQPQT